MTKSILLMGSTGFIGKNIYDNLKKNKLFKIYRYSTSENIFIDKVETQNFDVLIFASGIHKSSNYENNCILFQSRKNIKILSRFIDQVERVIFISSFKTSFNTNKKFVDSNNKYNFYRYDSLYGKSKILAEKICKYLCHLKNKRIVILSPSHVIGPEKILKSINNFEIKKIKRKNIIFYPDCFISLVDVRNISYFVEEVISSNIFDNKKVILNDKSLKYEEYVKHIKKGDIYLHFKVNKIVLKIIFLIQPFLINLKILKNQIINKSQIAYIDLNPTTKTSEYSGKISFEQTMDDIKKSL